MADSLSLATHHDLPATFGVRRAAQILGVSEMRLRRMIARGELRTVTLGKWPVITLAELRRVLGEG